MSELHCPGCGRRVEDVPCEPPRGCLPELDPPRYCARCGGWLAVQVSTGGWRGRCRSCDEELRSA